MNPSLPVETSTHESETVMPISPIAILPIVTNRLQLVSLSLEYLRALCDRDARDGNSVLLKGESRFTVPADSGLYNNPWVARRLRLIEDDPKQHPWMYRAIVRKSDSVMVGHISFHHKAPDPDLLEYSEERAVFSPL